jgi:hypothetical protein
MAARVAPVLCAAVGNGPAVTITGGSEPTGRTYTWTITNQSSSPIVSIEFRHYHGNVFVPAQGWSADGSTFREGGGWRGQEAKCVGRAMSAEVAIGPGESGEFQLLMDVAGAPRGTGEMKLGLADGTTAVVAGVELPREPSISDTYVSLIGLGGIFGLWLVFQAVRRRRRVVASG